MYNELIEAVRDISDDYMTSETHHPGWVLIAAERFEKLKELDHRIAISELGAEAQSY